MEVSTLVEKTGGSITARRVFSDPIEKDGVTVVFAASLRGGAGGGEGVAEGGEGRPQNEGGGAGFGLMARPVGAFVIRGERVEWCPAVDVNRIILGAQLVAGAGLLLLRTFANNAHRTRTRRARGLRRMRRVHH